MSTNNFWNNSQANNDGNDPDNWSLGHVPTTGEIAYFDVTSTDDCTLSDDLECDGIYAEQTYAGGHFNAGANNVTLTVSGATFLNAGTVTFGTGTWNVFGDLIYGAVDTVNGSGSHVILYSDGVWDGKALSSHWIEYVDVDNGAYITMGNTGSYTCFANLEIINGTVEVPNGEIIRSYGGYLDIHSSGTLTGAGLCELQSTGAGDGVRTLAGTLDVATFYLNGPAAAGTFAAGTYGSALTHIRGWTSGTTTIQVTLAAGTTEFSGTLRLDQAGGTSSRDVILQTTGETNLTINDLDLQLPAGGSGDVSLSFQGTETNLTISGDVTITKVGSGDFTTAPGHGTFTISGSSNQSVDFNDQALGTYGGVCDIQKTGGTLTFTGGLSTGTMTVHSGSNVVFGSNTIAVNSLDVQSGSTVDPSGTVFTASNDLDFDNQDFSSVSPWTVNGNNLRLKKCYVANCNASGITSSATADRRSRNKGGNTGITFATYIAPGSSMLTGVG